MAKRKKTLGQICFEGYWRYPIPDWDKANEMQGDKWERAAAAVEKEVLRRLKAEGKIRTKEQMDEMKNMLF